MGLLSLSSSGSVVHVVHLPIFSAEGGCKDHMRSYMWSAPSPCFYLGVQSTAFFFLPRHIEQEFRSKECFLKSQGRELVSPWAGLGSEGGRGGGDSKQRSSNLTLSFHLKEGISVCLSFYLSIYLPTYPFIYLSSAYPSLHLSLSHLFLAFRVSKAIHPSANNLSKTKSLKPQTY